MVTLEQFLVGIKFRITEGSDYGWRCYGFDAHRLESFVEDEYSAEVIFDRGTQVIYEAAVCDYRTNRCYRLFNPQYMVAHDAEADERGVDVSVAWDDVRWIDLETDEDYLAKLAAIVDGRSYDTRVMVPIDLPKEDLFVLMQSAHERDITLNQLMLEILEDAIKKQSSGSNK